ncbi:rod-binding protein [Sphingomonas gei]|uniref:Rod-binding protein n=1 Tax=Sphingomonas gei TaxID=1395960 RepID=A0A4S1XC39_9SPHN|nr:rod-binding protein [Sphingomonas gei]TGX53233.1 rod-binding protein [Sphingomonas gei]
MSTPIAPIAGGVSIDTSRLASSDNLEAAGKRFEAIFTGMMLKSMRSAKLGDGLFDSKASEQFRDMQDQQLAQAMAAHAPIGIGKAMTEFLARNASLAPRAEGSDTP